VPGSEGGFVTVKNPSATCSPEMECRARRRNRLSRSARSARACLCFRAASRPRIFPRSCGQAPAPLPDSLGCPLVASGTARSAAAVPPVGPTEDAREGVHHECVWRRCLRCAAAPEAQRMNRWLTPPADFRDASGVAQIIRHFRETHTIYTVRLHKGPRKRQRRSILQPRVARRALPWVSRPKKRQP